MQIATRLNETQPRKSELLLFHLYNCQHIKIIYREIVGVFITSLRTKFRKPSLNGSLVLAINPKATQQISRRCHVILYYANKLHQIVAYYSNTCYRTKYQDPALCGAVVVPVLRTLNEGESPPQHGRRRRRVRLIIHSRRSIGYVTCAAKIVLLIRIERLKTHRNIIIFCGKKCDQKQFFPSVIDPVNLLRQTRVNIILVSRPLLTTFAQKLCRC